ncbi:MAG: hypothetical protein A2Z88_00515 [Omnitrophica WOR_2 bacterium GWA2_47_8]|nr:MAG: hypothetical protein A2Z88_00515 [Omnitrophica WOR_2 bacterium GWA2_47_8]
MWHVYILKTKNGKLYTGITKDLTRRMRQHNSGNGGRFTRAFGFKKLLYSEIQPTRSHALKRESQIKTWPRNKKLTLVSKSPHPRKNS